MTSTIDFIQQVSDEIDKPFIGRWRASLETNLFEQFIYLGKELPEMSENLKSKYWAELDSIFKSVSRYKSMVVSHSLYITLTQECSEDFREELNRRVSSIKRYDR